ncbi:hypothetical protein BDR03DRAFT_944292 [Suillus americanus]|nr:hypothetical protein BDR03DRAFT_944292 [Suillus americanus]
MYMMAPRTYRPSHPILSGLQTNTLDAGRRGVVFGVASGAYSSTTLLGEDIPPHI